MDIRQWVINLASKLRKQFPEGGGIHAVTMNTPQHMRLNEGFDGDPTADNRPDFIKQDEVGWQVIGRSKGK